MADDNVSAAANALHEMSKGQVIDIALERCDEIERLREALEKVVADLENEPYTFAQKYSERALKIARVALHTEGGGDG